MSQPRSFFQNGVLSANGSGSALTGVLLISVKVAPNVMFTLAAALIAQPLALSRGDRLRLRNLSQARIMAGPEMTSIITAISTSHCHQTKPERLLATTAKAPPIAANAKPNAANIPANLAMSNTCFFSAPSPDVGTLAVISAVTLSSLSAAFFSMVFSMNLPSLR